MSDPTKVDPRLARTKRNLHTALFRIIMKKPLKNISVTELSNLAGINRGTFYLHYSDVFQMVNSVQKSCISHFLSYCSKYTGQAVSAGSLLSFFSAVTKYAKEYEPLFLAMFHVSQETGFTDKLCDALNQVLVSMIYPENMNEMKDAFSLFVAAGAVNVIRQWLECQKPASAEEIAKQILLILLNGGKL